ncbi:exosortase system-associated protein, TIGR04073 family [Prosthecobacter vanneervenii]|uniref:Putative exosortase-associated protein (TIGR04073 family) n=1 Tax=Prosthecobacter vanneervenii TaxID=48466 RepID=A0A7W7YCC4_9BACT|nr:exosortase system-associated protein, TIGR04073 family [Prosthecobacter vanneervenii]MBB5033554.1 putative exosortase-associated protein (TIGR04073 family) [Prosthecobacter vanneervenii]
MKNRFLLIALSLFTVSSIAYGDIQSPPGHHYTWSRKLSRGVGNILFGWFEYPSVWRHTNQSEGNVAATSDMIVEGTKRTFVRAGYGIYEIATFMVPSWKKTYRPPYHHKENVEGWWGYTEFAPQIGFRSEIPYSSFQSW